MSNALKKRKTNVGFTGKDKKIIRENLKMEKEDMAIMTMTKKLQLMTYMALYDVFEFKEKRLKRFHRHMEALKASWADEKVPTVNMLRYCEKKKINVYQYAKEISQSQKIALVEKYTSAKLIAYIEPAFLTNVLMSVIILKEEFRFSNPMIEKYLKKMAYYIDSYTRKQPGTNRYYLNNEMIIEIFRDEIKLNIETGEKIA